MTGVARFLMAAGVVLFLAGAALYLAARLGLPLGRLPGDVSYEGKNVRIFAPITTMIIVSLVLTLVLNIFSRWRR